MEELIQLREQIDTIDDKITELYAQRMALAKQIGIVKDKKQISTTDNGREKAIINRVTAKVDDDIKVYTKQVFNTMFDTSKAYQNSFVHLDSDIKRRLVEGLANITDFPKSASVACQGVAGAYSSIAAERLFEISDITYFKDFNGVFSAIERGFCEYGILPVENTTAGTVNSVYDLMKKHEFYIVKTLCLRVQHSLLAKNGVKLEDIKEVISHEQAISQCKGLLNKLGVKVTIVENTATAAMMVAQSDRVDIAAISSKECADIYGLKVLQSNVQDAENNVTRFICISKNLKVFKGANKISLILNIPHVKGSLNKILTKFSTLSLNLTKLESRPLPNTDFEFAFYFDFEGDVEDVTVQNLLSELQAESDSFTFLGYYKEEK